MLLTIGDATVANPTQWRVNPSNASNATQLPAAYTFGVEAQDYTVLPVGPLNDSNTQGSDTTIFRGDNYWEYPFLNRNLKHLHPNGLVSTRTVRASATCTQLSVMPTWIIDSGRYYVNASVSNNYIFLPRYRQILSSSLLYQYSFSMV